MSEQEHDHNDCWDDFWAPLLTDENGEPVLDLIKRELHDFHMLIEFIPRIYDELTGGVLSKPFYTPETVINVVEENFHKKRNEYVVEILRDIRDAIARRDGGETPLQTIERYRLGHESD